MSRPTWANETRKLSDLIPWPRNPRQIKKDEAARLNESFEEFGQPDVIAIGPDNEVYNGHQRLRVWAAKHGPDLEVAVRVASRALTEKEREKLVVLLHRGAVGEWDFDTLANEFELDELLEWGFEERDLQLDLWHKEPPEDPGPQIDRAEELQAKWQVQRGQIWQIGRHRLMCGDSTCAEDVERLMGGEKAALVVTDPPYGIDVVPESGEIGWSTKSAKVSKFSKIENDDAALDVSFILETGDKVAIFGGNYFAHDLPPSGRWFVWDKDFTDAERDFVPFSECELIWTNINGVAVKKYKCRSMGYSREGESGSRLHPTQKPVKVIAGIIADFSKDGDAVGDWFLGSGTTLVACEQTGRIGYGMEIEPKYCAVTLERLTGMGLEARLLEP